MNYTKKDKDHLREIKKELSKEAVWIGEDGNMACVSSSARGALYKFKRLMRGDVGESEAEEMNKEDVGIGWLRLPTLKDIEEHGLEHEWYVHYKSENRTKDEVYVYNA